MRLVPVLRRVGALVTLVVLAVCGVAVPASTATADGSTGIGISPVTAGGKPDGRTRFSYKVDPGQMVTDHVRVTNTGTTPLAVTVFSADAYNDDAGNFALKPTNEKATGAATWARFAGKQQLKINLKRGESRTVEFTVTIPKDATPGDHTAGVLASATTAGQVTVDRRIADRLYVRVSGALQPVLTISSFSGAYHSGLNPLDGSITVTATITNSGNVALEGAATLSANTWFGLGLGQTVRQDLPEILPGNTSTVSFEIPGVPQVGYGMVRMLVQGGTSGDAPDPGPLPVITRDAFVLAVPWLLLLVIAVGVGVWFLLRWKRRRDDAYAAEWMAHTEAEARLKAAGDHVDGQRLAMAGDGVRDDPAEGSR